MASARAGRHTYNTTRSDQPYLASGTPTPTQKPPTQERRQRARETIVDTCRGQDNPSARPARGAVWRRQIARKQDVAKPQKVPIQLGGHVQLAKDKVTHEHLAHGAWLPVAHTVRNLGPHQFKANRVDKDRASVQVGGWGPQQPRCDHRTCQHPNPNQTTRNQAPRVSECKRERTNTQKNGVP